VSSSWAHVSRSPWPKTPSSAEADPRIALLTNACGQTDAALERVAQQGETDPERLVSLLRESGEPHVRPRVVTAKGRAPLEAAGLAKQLASLKRPHSRCGVALLPVEDAEERLVAITVDALADLEPLPTRARTGEWLSFSAALHDDVGATNAKLVILGPRGAPRTVPTNMDASGHTVRARFALDQPGAFTVQLVAELADHRGPQPLLEARVFADMAPTTHNDLPAPGENESGAGSDALFRMTAELRKSEGLLVLSRDARLDVLAEAHLRDMIAKRAIAHDVGDGDLRERFERESLSAAAIGENVAKAKTLPLAHRALHASPSHRMNLLRSDYTHLGLATGSDDRGMVYVCEVFAARLR